MPKLDEAFLSAMRGPIHHVWGEVGHEAQGVATQAEAMEIVLDANRLTIYGEEKADLLVGEAFKEHGYTKVVRYLLKHISL